MSLCQHDKVKNNSYDCQKQKCENVSLNNQKFSFIVWLINMFPDNLVWFRSLFYKQLCRGVGNFVVELINIIEVLGEILLFFHRFLERIKYRGFITLSSHNHDHFVTLDSVIINLFPGLLNTFIEHIFELLLPLPHTLLILLILINLGFKNLIFKLFSLLWHFHHFFIFKNEDEVFNFTII